MYPMLLDVSKRLIVIVGGGAVAARKAAGLIDAGATRIRVVAKEFRDSFSPIVERINEPYRPDHLDGAGLVFAATDSSEVNDLVVSGARKHGVLVCRVDGEGDFITPAVHRDGAFTLAVSTGSAALSARVRDDLASTLDPALVQMANELKSLRPTLRKSGQTEVLRSLATREAAEVLRTHGANGLRAWVMNQHASSR